MPGKRNPIKQIMSEVHKDVRAGKLDLSGHGGFIAEVKRRVRAAGLADDELHELVARRRPPTGEQHEGPADRSA
jgi:hypothetical protein